MNQQHNPNQKQGNPQQQQFNKPAGQMGMGMPQPMQTGPMNPQQQVQQQPGAQQ